MSNGSTKGTSWPHVLRLAVAFLLPAAIGGFVGSAILAFTAFAKEIATAPVDQHAIMNLGLLDVLAIGTFLGAIYGQVATALIGLPAHVWLMKNTRCESWMYIAAGAIAGFVFGGLFVWPMLWGQTVPPPADIAALAAAGLAAGASAGLTFWLIRRPDRDAPASAPPPAAAPAHRTHAQAGDT